MSLRRPRSPSVVTFRKRRLRRPIGEPRTVKFRDFIGGRGQDKVAEAPKGPKALPVSAPSAVAMRVISAIPLAHKRGSGAVPRPAPMAIAGGEGNDVLQRSAQTPPPLTSVCLR